MTAAGKAMAGYLKQHPHYDEMVRFLKANQSAVIESLSFDAAEIAERVSFDALLQLVDTMGGAVLFVPTGLRPDYEILRYTDEETARKLIEHFANCSMSIPPASKVIQIFNRAFIRRHRADGARKLAIATGLSERSVYRILQHSREMAGAARSGRGVLSTPFLPSPGGAAGVGAASPATHHQASAVPHFCKRRGAHDNVAP